jgi:hypothetical protein
MKKFVFKATALAIGALVGGGAFASVDFTPATFTATTDTFASELDYSKATGTTISGLKTITTKLGFGVSAGQSRYIRVNLTNAIIGATPAAGVNVTAVAPATNFSNISVVQGGQPNDNFVIYQVTAAAGGNAATDVITIALPNLFALSNSGSVKVAYSLYDDSVAAANQTAGTSLSTQSGDLFLFGSGVTFKVTTKTQTATVVDAYKKFSGSYGPVDVGSFNYAATAGVSKADGTAVALTDIVAAGTAVKFLGDFTFTDGANTPANLFLSNVGNCAAGTVALTAIAADNLSASYTLGATALNKSLCVTNKNGAGITSVALNAQTLTTDFNPVAISGNSVTDPSAVTLGSIARDGTTLTAPFATIHPDYLSRIVLNSTYGSDVPVTATVTTEGGATCTGSAFTTTLPKKSQLVINVKDICPALSTGGTRMAVTVSVAAPRSNIDGVYNVMNYDVTTGKTNSLISYIMVVPGSN